MSAMGRKQSVCFGSKADIQPDVRKWVESGHQHFPRRAFFAQHHQLRSGMACPVALLGICLTRPTADAGPAIFGFGEFLAALALLVLVFNSTDPLYRFRVSIAPLPLFRLTFGSIVIIGSGMLLTDRWFQNAGMRFRWVGREQSSRPFSGQRRKKDGGGDGGCLTC
jgi:hypothetical protein